MYRSKVIFSVPESAPRFEEIEDCFDDVLEKKGFRLYVAESIRWYDAFEVVENVMKFIKNNPDDCVFFRIGEEDNDSEFEGSLTCNPFDIYMTRDIDFIR